MPRSSGRTWTPETTAKLFDMTRQGLTQVQAARILRRTPKGVERKIAKLKKKISTLPFPQLVLLVNSWETSQYLLNNR
jgi:hypothetical protein